MSVSTSCGHSYLDLIASGQGATGFQPVRSPDRLLSAAGQASSFQSSPLVLSGGYINLAIHD